MTIQLIQLYVLVCEIHDTRRNTCFQRTSNNVHVGGITDQELITLYWFGHWQGHFEKKAIHTFIKNYWLEYFPKLPAYQTFVARLNRLEATFQSFGAEWQARLRVAHVPEVDQVIDSLPVMLARGGHAYTAKRGSAPRSGIARARNSIFTACADTSSRNAAAASCHLRNKFGYGTARATMSAVSKNKRLRYRQPP